MGLEGSDWVGDLFTAIDARDVDRFASFLDPQVVFRFANAEPSRGLARTRQVVSEFFAAVAALRHRIDDVWATDARRTVICRGEVCYTRLDGVAVNVPFANVFRLGDGGIREYSIYVDASPVFS